MASCGTTKRPLSTAARRWEVVGDERESRGREDALTDANKDPWKQQAEEALGETAHGGQHAPQAHAHLARIMAGIPGEHWGSGSSLCSVSGYAHRNEAWSVHRVGYASRDDAHEGVDGSEPESSQYAQLRSGEREVGHDEVCK